MRIARTGLRGFRVRGSEATVAAFLTAHSRNDGGGVVSGISGAWSEDQVWVSFQSFVQPPSIYRYDYLADHLSPYHVPDGGLDASAFTTEQVSYPRPTAPRCRCSSFVARICRATDPGRCG